MTRLLSVLFWAVIAAAFIGPGTVTTAATAGAGFGTALLWALAFSTFACLVLQEAAGRLRLVSGRSLGGALRERFPAGVSRWAMLILVLGAVLLGNAAYEAGNILGGVAGASLVVGWPTWLLTLLASGLAGALLWSNAPRRVAQVLGVAVAVMGVAFLVMAIGLRPDPSEIVRGLLVPSLPSGAGLLVLGLVGTTVVPYNLFLGSGLAHDQSLPVFRFGLAVAVILGGIISMGILVVGTRVEPPMSFEGLAAALGSGLGEWAVVLLAVGLACAGLSSAITAPLAAALTAKSLFADGPADPVWSPRGGRYRAVWGSILLIGTASGLSGVRPVPAIILAQALNGVVLPAIAIYLLLAVNDRGLMGRDGLNGRLSNASMVLVTLVALVLGVAALARAAATVTGSEAPSMRAILLAAGLLVALAAVPVARSIHRRRRDRGDPRRDRSTQ